MRIAKGLATGSLALALAAPAAAQQSEPDSLRQTVQEQQRRIEQLEQRLDATAGMIEQGIGQGWWQSTQIGGYGELHYNGGDDPQIDFHRFVLFFNHQFNDDIRLFSELEVEHAYSGDDKGAVELEQAYIEFDLTDNHRAIGGLFLVPVGILNETHEPNTFYGVERNPVESAIIPTTWWEGGAGLRGRLAPGYSYDLALHSGLYTDEDFNLRDGRQKVAKATAEAGAVTGRLRWTGIPGVEVGTTLQYQQDLRQSEGADEVPAVLAEVHTDISKGPFGLRALYAQWALDGDAPEDQGKDEQYGYYVEPSFKVTEQIGLFARYSAWDTAAGNDDTDSEMAQVDAGVNYWPHPRVVVKADYTMEDKPDNDDEEDFINLGIGYQF